MTTQRFGPVNQTQPSAGSRLSVAELQRAMQVGREESVTDPRTARGIPTRTSRRGGPGVPARPERRVRPALELESAYDAAPNLRTIAEAPPLTVAVVGSHGGAGASTVAVAIADAAADAGRDVRLLGPGPLQRSGLLTAADAELGLSDDGQWRLGRRSAHISVERFDGSDRVAAFPTLGATDALTIIDWDPYVDVTPREGVAVVLVFRVTVPGVRHMERLLIEVVERGNWPILAAAVGPRRWPGLVTGSLGARLQQLRSEGRVVDFPVDRHLALTGPTSDPLPRPLLRAGAELLSGLSQAGVSTGPVPTNAMGCPPTQLVTPATTATPTRGATERENCA
jgi:hypothetical protein